MKVNESVSNFEGGCLDSVALGVVLDIPVFDCGCSGMVATLKNPVNANVRFKAVTCKKHIVNAIDYFKSSSFNADREFGVFLENARAEMESNL